MHDDASKYWAFISYSHKDKEWADWLHKSLESYRVPRRLVGRLARDATIPKRLYPVFRDREELPSSSDLGGNIDLALRQSRCLIVICSPNCSGSRWVNEEIRKFKHLGREDRVLALIVAGEPNASDREETSPIECFPPALRHAVDAAGEIQPARVEPIAADVRPGMDGKSNALLKLVAGALGVGYDDLRQRDRQRRLRRQLQWGIAATLVLALAWAGWYWRAKQASAAGYAELGRSALLADHTQLAAAYLAAAYRDGDDSPAVRFMLHQALNSPDFNAIHWVVSGIPFFTTQFSPDDHHILVIRGNHLEVRDTVTGAQLWNWTSPNAGALFEHAYSPSGDLIAIVDVDAAGAILKAQTGQVVCRFHEPNGVGALAFNPDGKTLATFGASGDIRIRSVTDGSIVQWFHVSQTQGNPVREITPKYITFDQHGGNLLVAWESVPNGKWNWKVKRDTAWIEAFNVAAGVPIKAWGSSFSAYSAFTPDENGVLSYAPSRNVISIAGLGSGEMHPAALSGAQWGEARMQMLASASTQDLADFAKYWLTWTWVGPNLIPTRSSGTEYRDNITYAALSGDGKHLAIASEHGGVRVIQSVTGTLEWASDVPDEEIKALALDSVGARLAMMDREGVVRIIDVATPFPVLKRIAHTSGDVSFESTRQLRFNPMGDTLYVTADSAIYKYRSSDGLTAGQYDSPCGTGNHHPYIVHLSRADNRHIEVLCGEPVDKYGSLKVIGPGTPSPFGTISLSGNWASDFDKSVQYFSHQLSLQKGGNPIDWAATQMPIAFSNRGTFAWVTDHTGSLVAAEGEPHQVEIWNTSNETKIAALPKIPNTSAIGATFTPDDSVLEVVYRDGQIQRWDVRGGKLIESYNVGVDNLELAQFTSDGSDLLFLAGSGAKIFALQSKSIVAALEAYQDSSPGVVVSSGGARREGQFLINSPDGNFVIGGMGHYLAVWDSHSGKLLTLLGQYWDGLISVNANIAISPDGTRLATKGDYEDVRLIDIGLETKSVSAIERYLACKDPWNIVDGRATEAALDATQCVGDQSGF